MISVRVLMKLDRSPLKRALVALRLDTRDQLTPSVPTDRSGIARFDLPHAAGTVLVAGIERFGRSFSRARLPRQRDWR
jgi:tRNA 2-thiouridine synthesizing protein E